MSEIGQRPDAGRLGELDAFRGIAALWVVLFHYFARYLELFPIGAPLDPVASALSRVFTSAGGLAPVYAFFTISGFVISWTLLRSRTAADFLVSRATRLYPAYWIAAALAATLSITLPLPGLSFSPAAIIAAPTMLQNFIGLPDLDGAWWSLAVELIFYGWMLCALLAGLAPRSPIICLVWACACLATHVLGDLGVDVPYRVQKYGMLIHGQCFAAGVMLHEIWRGRNMSDKNGAMAASVLAASAAAVFAAYSLTDSFVWLAFVALFLLAIRGQLRWIATPPLLWLGAISYSLYITHQTVGWRVIAVLEHAGAPYEIAAAVALVVALTLASVISHLIERPAQRWLRGVWRRREQRRMGERSATHLFISATKNDDG